MNKDLDILLKMSLFDGIKPQELTAILNCLQAKKKHYQKNEMVTVSGGDIQNFGVVLSGSVQILKDDATGRQTILAALGAGETFAEVLVCAGVKKSPVTVLAVTEADVLFLNYAHVVRTCTSACAFHSTLISNMLKLLAQKNLAMNSKISYLLLKSMRQKLAAYLLEQCGTSQNTELSIPFSRSGLADFLNVDRSAMSRELSRMRDDGLIEFEKSRFKIIDKDGLYLCL
jgi:CRP/FNR family transcriptional regulator, dissimilatory nitrate respiration regulator